MPTGYRVVTDHYGFQCRTCLKYQGYNDPPHKCRREGANVKKLTERQRFEKWTKRVWLAGWPEHLERCYDAYSNSDVESCWRAWQASARVKRTGSKSGEGR